MIGWLICTVSHLDQIIYVMKAVRLSLIPVSCNFFETNWILNMVCKIAFLKQSMINNIKVIGWSLYITFLWEPLLMQVTKCFDLFWCYVYILLIHWLLQKLLTALKFARTSYTKPPITNLWAFRYISSN